MVYSQDSGYNFASRFRPYVGPGLALSQLVRPRFGSMFQSKGAVYSTAYKRRKLVGSRNSFAKRVRNLAPYKHNTINDSANTTTMTHNTIYTTNITAKVAQGLTNTDRIGDFIHLSAMKVRGLIVTPAVTGAFAYRIIVGYSGEEYNVTASNAGLVASEIFLPSTGAFVVGQAIINPKAFTCLYDEIVDINSLTATAQDLKSVQFKVNLNARFPYQASTSTMGKTRNLYFVIIGHVVGGVAGTTSTGTGSFNSDLIF